jgi:hypothetical protein
MNLNRPTIIDLPRIEDPRGALSFIQNLDQCPFVIERTYWIYDVPGQARRDGHAFRSQQELIVALSGSFDVVSDDGRGEPRRFTLNRPDRALFLPPLTWRRIDNFATNSVAMVLSSATYDSADYIRDYQQFKDLADNERR